MLKLDYLQELLVISIALSAITCAMIQKTKCCFGCSKYLSLYSLVINMTIGIVFCMSFTDISFPTSLWIGFFAFLGADTIYKSLEGKLSSHSDIINRKTITISRENLINEEEKG